MEYKQSSFSWINKKCTLVKNTGGIGVYATDSIKKNELISLSGGNIMFYDEEKKSQIDKLDYSLQLDNFFGIGIKYKKDIEYSCFFNHSCNPNIGIKGQLYFVSMRNIRKGEQLCFDYAMTLDKMRGADFYKMKCLCGSKNCRGFITEDDWKIPELQKKYDGYFQWFIQEKINCIKSGEKYKKPYFLPKSK
jgi:hypothetical protein